MDIEDVLKNQIRTPKEETEFGFLLVELSMHDGLAALMRNLIFYVKGMDFRITRQDDRVFVWVRKIDYASNNCPGYFKNVPLRLTAKMFCLLAIMSVVAGLLSALFISVVAFVIADIHSFKLDLFKIARATAAGGASLYLVIMLSVIPIKRSMVKKRMSQV